MIAGAVTCQSVTTPAGDRPSLKYILLLANIGMSTSANFSMISYIIVWFAADFDCMTVKPTRNSLPVTSLFDSDSDDDLFSNKPTRKPPQRKKGMAALFHLISSILFTDFWWQNCTFWWLQIPLLFFTCACKYRPLYYQFWLLLTSNQTVIPARQLIMELSFQRKLTN